MAVAEEGPHIHLELVLETAVLVAAEAVQQIVVLQEAAEVLQEIVVRAEEEPTW
jgi:hypothetical protein